MTRRQQQLARPMTTTVGASRGYPRAWLRQQRHSINCLMASRQKTARVPWCRQRAPVKVCVDKLFNALRLAGAPFADVEAGAPFADDADMRFEGVVMVKVLLLKG